MVALAGFVFLTLPRPVGWVAQHVHKEDGDTFLRRFLERGWASTFDIYSGYLHVLPRTITGVCASALPPGAYSGCVTAASHGMRVWLFVLAVAVAAAWLGATRWTLAVASPLLFVAAGQHEVLGNVTNLRWLGVAFVFLAFAAAFTTPWLSVLAALGVALAVLSDPLALGAVPFALARLFSPGWARLVPAAYLAATGVQAASLQPSHRGLGLAESVLAQPAEAALQELVRGVVVSEDGVGATQLVFRFGGWPGLLVVAVLPLVAVGWLITRWRREPPAALLGLYLTAAAVAAFCATLGIRALLAERTPHALVWRVLGWVTLLAALGGVLADFRGDPWSTRGQLWPDTVRDSAAACADGRGDVTVPFTPQGVPQPWSAPLPCAWLTR